jgi:general secretion pathway protein D
MKIVYFILIVLCLLVKPAVAQQQIDEVVFQNQSFHDIFVALSYMAGVTILPDHTVQGYTSYYFLQTDFLSGFSQFLEANHLFYTVENNIYKVSRIQIIYDSQNDLISMQAVDVDNKILVQELAKATMKTILMENIPNRPLTVRAKDISFENMLEILLRQSDDYKIEVNDHYYLIKGVTSSYSNSMFVQRSMMRLDEGNGLYSANIESSRLVDLIYDLFTHEQREYAMMFRGDTTVENFRYYQKEFDFMLKMLLQHGGADYTIVDGVYYIFETSRSDVAKRLRIVREIKLNYVDITEIIPLLPPGVLDGARYTVLKRENSLLMSGNLQEIAHIEQILRLFDVETGIKRYYTIPLKYMQQAAFAQLIQDQDLTKVMPISNDYAVTILATQEEYARVLSLLQAVDVPTASHPIHLRFIRSQDLMERLPPSISQQEIQLSLNANIIYFKGTQEKKALFLQELKLIDKPEAQIKYDILVVQYQNSQTFNWSKKLEIGSGSSSSISGDFGNLLGFKFDIISSLGINFAANLNLSMRNNEAVVLADTQLNALYGKAVKFQNTTTSRYAVREVDNETGRQLFASKIQEITSGLIISITGWVSGDQMITMDLMATISREGSSSDPEMPPSTYEKILTTHVRTLSGKPIVIGGLIQQDDEVMTSGIPGLRNPVFDDRSSRREHTEFVLYIIPHLEMRADDRTVYSQKMEDMLSFMKENL